MKCLILIIFVITAFCCSNSDFIEPTVEKDHPKDSISFTDIYRLNGIELEGDFKNACTEILWENFPYWIRDSLGRSGFRILFAEEKLIRCLPNQKWIDIEKYLGKPFFKPLGGLYRYRLNESEYPNMFLRIEVQDSIISFCKVEEWCL